MDITVDDEDGIQEWLNVEIAEIDESGDVWVANPCVGRWLSAEQKAAYVEWRDQRSEARRR